MFSAAVLYGNDYEMVLLYTHVRVIRSGENTPYHPTHVAMIATSRDMSKIR